MTAGVTGSAIAAGPEKKTTAMPNTKLRMSTPLISSQNAPFLGMTVSFGALKANLRHYLGMGKYSTSRHLADECRNPARTDCLPFGVPAIPRPPSPGITLRLLLPAALLALAACGAPVSETLTTVRHVPSNTPYGTDGARLHLFVFDPSQPRSLADRKAIARRQIALEPSCAWVEAPDSLLIEETRNQGERYAETMLVAPLRCSRT